MAKGLAVISGSSTVVFKALETGVVKMGGVHPDGSSLFAGVTISGSLALSGSEGVLLHVSGSEFKLENLSGISDRVIISGSSLEQAVKADGSNLEDQRDGVAADNIGTQRDPKHQLRGGLVWAATSSIAPEMSEKTVVQGGGQVYLDAIDVENQYEMPEDFLVITKEGELRRVNKIDASAVMLNDGQTVEQQVGGLNLDLKLSSSHGLGIEGIDEKDVNLTRGSLNFKDVQYRTKLSMSNDDSGESVEVKVDLDPELRVETLSASMGLEVTGSSKLRGDLHVVKDLDAGLSGDATVDGNMTIKGDLNVWGDTSVTTAESKHMKIEDAVVRIGTSMTTGSEVDAATSGLVDLGFLFGDVNTRAMLLDGGNFYLGLTGSATTLDANGNPLDIEMDVTSDAAKAITVYVPNLSASAKIEVGGTADITGKLTAKANVDLGSGPSNIVTIKGTLTASAPARFKGAINVADGADVVLEQYSDLTLDEGKITLTKGNLEITEGSAVLAKGNVDVQDGNLDVNGITTLSASEGGNTTALSVKGTTSLSSSANSNALHVDSGNVLFDEALTVGGVVTLNDIGGALNVEGLWFNDQGVAANPAVDIKGSLNVDGNARLGTDVNNRVIVQGQFRIPKFTRAEVQAQDFISNASAYEGFMFYLDSDHDDTDPYFPRGRKWYFNEGGVWHSSFFWDDGAEVNAGDGDPNTP